MKICVLLSVGMLLSALEPAVRADSPEGLSVNFSDTIYQLGKSVVGVDGWVAAGLLAATEAENADGSAIEPFVHDGAKKGLMLRVYGVDRTMKKPLRGRVKVDTRLYYASMGQYHLSLAPILGGRVDHFSVDFEGVSSKGEAGFSYCIPTTPGTNEVPRKVLLVPEGNLAEGKSYTISTVIDIEAQTLTVAVSGEKPDGTPLEASSGEVDFSRSHLGLNARSTCSGVRLMGSGRSGDGRLLIESISIQRTD